MKWGWVIIVIALTILPVGYIHLNKERMKHLKSIEQFKTNEQLFRREIEGFSKLFGGDKKDSSQSTSTSSSDSSSKGTISSDKMDIGDYGKFTEGKDKTSPLVVVYGGIDVGGRKSGEYMYDYLNKTGNSANLFVAKDSNINGKSAYEALKNKLSAKSINPSKKILYLFSGGYKPGMELLKSVSASEFDIIYLVDIWMGNSKVSDFYTNLCKNNRNKVKYFYTSFGANDSNATKNIIGSLNYYKLNGENDHMSTNKDAVSDLISNI